MTDQADPLRLINGSYQAPGFPAEVVVSQASEVAARFPGNRLADGPAGTGPAHNAAGNLTRIASRDLTYDAEGRITRIHAPLSNSVEQWRYDYDGLGNRVRQLHLAGPNVDNLTVLDELHFIYDGANQLLAEYAVQGSPIPVEGTQYVTTDWLGSTRVTTGPSGAPTSTRDYLPFGEEIRATSAGPSLKFTGKERQNYANLGLDYSLYRYSSAAQGRWLSPDPLPGWPADPQSWNRYAYVRNNPLLYTDPLGLSYEICGVDGKDCGVYSDKQYDKLRKDKQFVIANGKIFGRNKDGTTGDQLGTVKDQGRDHEDRGLQVIAGLGARADASNRFIGTFATGSTAVGLAGGGFVAATQLSSGGFTTLTTGGEAIGIEGLQAEALTLVSRWGRSGLQPGDWVMGGGTGVWTYLMSFKWQPGMGNQFAPFTTGQNFLVPKATITNPGWVEKGAGWVKALYNQWIYRP